MKKTALLIMVITLASKFLGFGREVVLSYYFGATNITDIYLIAITIPGAIIGFIGGGIATTYIPMQTRVMTEGGQIEGNKYTSNFTNVVLLITTLILTISMLFTPYLVKIFAAGFTGETLELAVFFTRITLFTMYCSVLTSIASGYLQIKDNYIAPVLIGFPRNIIIILFIYLAAKGNYTLLVIGYVFALIAQVAFLLPFMIKEKYKHYFRIDFKDENLKRTFYIALPIIIGSSISTINSIVDRTIATTLVEGGVSALNYANTLIAFVTGLFITSIITVLYPTISKYASANDYDGMKASLKESINLISIFIIPIIVGAVLLNREVVWMIYGRGAFDATAIQLTSAALLFYSLGVFGIGIREAISRAYYAMQDTKTPMVNAAIGIVINIVLNIILSRYMGIAGLALATSIAGTVTAILIFLSFRKKIGPFGMKEVAVNVLKISTASAVMGVAAKMAYDYLVVVLESNMFALLSAIAVGAVVYFVIIYFMKIRDVDVMVNAVKVKVKGRTN